MTTQLEPNIFKDCYFKPIRCDGEVLFGFTVKACDKPATRRVWTDEAEEYWFCEEHYQKAIQGGLNVEVEP